MISEREITSLKNCTPRVDRPIFFIGAPRSGTTIVFEAFSSHSNLAWFSNFLHRFPGHPIVSVVSRLAISPNLMGWKRQNGESRFRIPRPYAVECFPAWERCCGRKFRFDFLSNQTVSETDKRNTIELVSRVTKYQGKQRFTAKITGPPRICYLDSIFPDAFFIHIMRDGRAVSNSLMRVGFWKKGGGFERPWWTGGLTQEDMETYDRYDKSPLVLAAIQWRRIILAAKEEASRIAPQRYLQVKYEDILREPLSFMDKLIEFSELPASEKVETYVRKKSRFRDMNFKFAHDLSGRDLTVLNEVIGDVNSSLGYTV